VARRLTTKRAKPTAPKRPAGYIELPTIEQCAKAIGWPVALWKGHCFTVASMIVDRKLIKGGRAVYGHFIGKVDPKSYFGERAHHGFVQHGWVLLPDGRVFDPTRWAFEDKAPYIFVGPADDYDEGGNRFRTAMHGNPPDFDPDEKSFDVPKRVLASGPWTHVEKLLRIDVTTQEPGTLSEAQLFWLANADFSALQPHAFEVYQAIATLGRIALIPYDNRRTAERLAGKVVVADD